MPTVPCTHCSTTFYAKPSAIQKGNGKYCSMECHTEAKRKGKEVACATCAKKVYRQGKDLKRSQSGKYFCDKSCQTTWRNRLYVGEKHKNFRTGESSYRERMKRSKVLKECRLCHTRDTRVLAVHHIDKNRSNNKIENLAWLCHNCHFLVHHYEGVHKAFVVTK